MSTGADGRELQLLLGDVDRGEGWTTRIGSSRALTQVQAGARADHHRRRSSSISSSSSHTVHRLPLLLPPLHVLIPRRLPRALLFTSLG